MVTKSTLYALLKRGAGAAVLAAATILYGVHGGSWTLFAVLLLAPDVSALGYLVNARVGEVCYNAAHIYAGGLLLGVLGLATGLLWLPLYALIWAAHIGMDRLLGYGLKDTTAAFRPQGRRPPEKPAPV